MQIFNKPDSADTMWTSLEPYREKIVRAINNSFASFFMGRFNAASDQGFHYLLTDYNIKY